ncbi:MAG: glycosyltransferase [Ilumatobacteraceae bacterium]
MLSYYWPYVSGLSEMARRLNEGLVRAGWDVHVVTTRYDRELAPHADVNGVSVRRCTSIGSVGRAAVSPMFPISAVRAIRNADVALIHLPLPEAAAVALGAIGRPLVALYHCDAATLRVPFEGVVQSALDWSSSLALRRSDVNVATSVDYAQHSRVSRHLVRKLRTVHPPCQLLPEGSPALRETDGPHFGFLGRIVPEKGLEYMVAAFRRLEDPTARLLIAGDFDEVAGGTAIRTVSKAARGDPRVRILGFLDDDALPDFYRSIDVFVLPSVDSFEAFGIVQAEALMHGVPVIASDLPGVRTVVQDTGAGIIVTPRDVDGLTAAMRRIVATTFDTAAMRKDAADRYGESSSVKALDDILRGLLPVQLRRSATGNPAPAEADGDHDS